MSRDKGFWPRVSKAGIAPRCPDTHQGRFLVSHDSAEISVIMTGLTELALGINRDKLAASILVGMAVNAPGKTVFDGANTLMHRLVTVMCSQDHRFR